MARAWLLERFPAGFEEHEAGSSVELAAYTDGTGEAEIRAAFAQATSEPVSGGWEDRWKEFHRPVRAGGLWIGPPWIAPPAGELAVVVDPGRAFGTGAHPTTRACIDLLAGLERGSLLDAGCGSGVVAVAAARLGFAPVRAVDLDEVAVEVTAETARANGVELEVARARRAARRAPRRRCRRGQYRARRRRGPSRSLRGTSRRDVGLPGRRTAARAGVDPRSAR